MEKEIQQLVRERAGYCCEYCRFPEGFAELPFHLDHVIARQHGGQTSLENLALACCYCNRYKGPNLVTMNPDTGQMVQLFHPRRNAWEEHFFWEGAHLIAKTPIGRGTIQLLQINRADAVAVRDLLMQGGVFVAQGTWVQEDGFCSRDELVP